MAVEEEEAETFISIVDSQNPQIIQSTSGPIEILKSEVTEVWDFTVLPLEIHPNTISAPRKGAILKHGHLYHA